MSTLSQTTQLNKKGYGRVGLLLALFSLIVVPPAALAANKGGSKFVRAPEVVVVENSQNMLLLEARNNIEPFSALGNTLAIVDDSAIESSGDSGEVSLDAGQGGSSQISVYIVRKGDTLAGIAKMFNVNTNTIIWANDIKGGIVREGDELVILPISGIKHTVRSGETFKSIAKKYKADLEDMLSYNGLSLEAKVAIGDVIIVPDGIVSSGADSSTITSVGNIASGIKTSLGYFIKPLNISRKTQGIHGKNGVDLAAPTGTPVMAVASGKVIIAKGSGWNGGYGVYAVVSHPNGTQTLYAHMDSVSVSAGQQVTQGQMIGSVGNTGKSTGPHLHIEVRGARNPF